MSATGHDAGGCPDPSGSSAPYDHHPPFDSPRPVDHQPFDHHRPVDHGRSGPEPSDPAGRNHPGHEHAGHSHGVSASSDSRYLAGALALIVAFMIGEVAAALLAGSLALLADAGHMLTDAAALALSMWALRLAARPAAGPMTYGFKRAEILSAMANGITLLVISALVTAEAVTRLISPARVDGPTVIVVAAVGVVVNALATYTLARADRTSLNIAGAFAHLMTDAWAFAGTLAAGVVIVVSGFDRADAIASLLTVVLMLRAGVGLTRAAGRVLLEAAPEGVDLDELRTHLLDLPQVTAVHDLHAWVVTSDLPAVSAHVVVTDECFAEGRSPRLLDELQACLAGHFDVTHSTFQIEPAGHASHEAAHHT